MMHKSSRTARTDSLIAVLLLMVGHTPVTSAGSWQRKPECETDTGRDLSCGEPFGDSGRMLYPDANECLECTRACDNPGDWRYVGWDIYLECTLFSASSVYCREHDCTYIPDPPLPPPRPPPPSPPPPPAPRLPNPSPPPPPSPYPPGSICAAVQWVAKNFEYDLPNALVSAPYGVSSVVLETVRKDNTGSHVATELKETRTYSTTERSSYEITSGQVDFTYSSDMTTTTTHQATEITKELVASLSVGIELDVVPEILSLGAEAGLEGSISQTDIEGIEVEVTTASAQSSEKSEVVTEGDEIVIQKETQIEISREVPGCSYLTVQFLATQYVASVEFTAIMVPKDPTAQQAAQCLPYTIVGVWRGTSQLHVISTDTFDPDPQLKGVCLANRPPPPPVSSPLPPPPRLPLPLPPLPTELMPTVGNAEDANEGGFPIAVVVGVGAGVLLCILVLLIVVVCLRRNRIRNRERLPVQSRPSSSTACTTREAQANKANMAKVASINKNTDDDADAASLKLPAYV